MTYKIKFIKQIHYNFSGRSSNDVYLKKIIELDFFPPIGMSVRVGDWYEFIENLHYDKNKNEFTVTTEPDKTRYEFFANNRNGNPPQTMEDLVADWVDDGWEVQQ